MLNILDNAYISVVYSQGNKMSIGYIVGTLVIILTILFTIFIETFCILSIHINGKGILKVFQGKLSILRILMKIIIPGLAFSFAG